MPVNRKKSKSLKVNSSGFTLIELLIVISIIAILSTIGLVSYTSFVKNARDAKRKSDMNFIQSALEQFHSDSKYYPVSLTSGSPLRSPDGSKVYLNEIPNDPKSSPQYCYVGLECATGETQGCKTYYLYAFLENSKEEPTKSGCGLTNAFNLEVTRP